MCIVLQVKIKWHAGTKDLLSLISKERKDVTIFALTVLEEVV